MSSHRISKFVLAVTTPTFFPSKSGRPWAGQLEGDAKDVARNDDVTGELDTYFLESDLGLSSAAVSAGWGGNGNWRLLTYLRRLGPAAYFVTAPSFFFDKTTENARFWFSYSANYQKSFPADEMLPPGSKYTWVLQKIKLVPRRAGGVAGEGGGYTGESENVNRADFALFA